MATPIIEPPQTGPSFSSGGTRLPMGRKPLSLDDPEELHLLIADLRDEASRSRMREAIWISIILHIVIIVAVRTMPKWMPESKVVLLTPEQQLQQQNKDLIYTELPKDNQKVTVKPDTAKISDKDRIATSKTPRVDPRTLERLANNRRTGAPGMGPQQPFVPPQPQTQAQAAQPAPQQMAENRPPQQQNTNPDALTQPQTTRKPDFRTPAPGAASAVDQAIRDAARSHGGIGGELGGGPGIPGNARMGNVEILSDTQGVDFSPYMQRVIQAIRTNWYAIIPEAARPPILKQGNVYIQFVIGKNGTVSGMRLESPSGDVSLDRAAWGGITGSNPFPPLPGQFTGPYLALRIKFLYNPDKTELR